MRPLRIGAALLAAVLVTAPHAAAQGTGGGIDWTNLKLPPDFLTLSNLEIFNGSTGGVMAAATTTLLNSRTNVLLATDKASGTTRNFILGLEPDDWSLTKAFPALSNPVLDDLKLNHVALVVTNRGDTADASQLADAEYAFYQPVYGTPDFTLILQPGVNLIAAIPLSKLPPNSPLLMAFKPLGMQPGPILLQGTLGKSLTMLGGGGGLDAIKDLFLSAALPPMRPPGAPDWFIDGQLALQLTGQPSVALVGNMTVKIKTDTLTFFLASTIAKTGLSLSGGLAAAHPWVAPFGIDWLTLNKVVLELGITPTGSVDLGFGGDMIIGKKDMDVAVALAINAASGVPTNFIIRGNSDAGFGLADLLALQEKMAEARAAANAASGQPNKPTPKIPLDALPDIEFRKVGLLFAPKPDPVLDIERGMAIKGQMWIPTGQGDQLKNFASVDVSATADGVWAKGHLGAFSLGPLTWSDAKLDLTLTPQDQHFIVKGDAKLFQSEQAVDLTISRKQLKFHTTTQLFNDMFTVDMDANAAFNLRNPAFKVDGVAQNDLSQVLGPVMDDGIRRFAKTGAAVIGRADTALQALQTAESAGHATVAQLKTTLENQRAAAEGAWQSAQRAADQAGRSASSAANTRNYWYNQWRNTPRRRPGLRASRHANYVRWSGIYAARAGVYAARRAKANALHRIYDAIPPVDQNILLMRADSALAVLHAKLQDATTKLAAIKDALQRVDAAAQSGGTLVALRHAEVHADLADLMKGQAVRWVLDGTFAAKPFHIDQKINFGDLHGAAAQLVTDLTEGS
ncbi:MAG TPA: hypothetical protein VJ992_11320 [Gemmatimonadales bacterium]|nr:hypothetical protein [Gemmatimonadales bacterium]